MMVAAHQPDLLPYTGFWHKMEKADLFFLLPYEQINHDGYTRRVKMRDKWASLQLEERHTGQAISELRMTEDAGFGLWQVIRGRYQGSKYWSARQQLVQHWVQSAVDCRSMWQFNFSLILLVRDWLGITTPVAFGPPRAEGMDATEKLVRLCDSVTNPCYLSGAGARDYLNVKRSAGDWDHLRGGCMVLWSEHVPWTGDSILTTIFDKDDPMEWVLNESQLEGASL